MKAGITYATIVYMLLEGLAAASQAGLLRDADKLDEKADYDSEDRAVEKGFEAFANLAALNIGGAIYNGKQAYQSYENSREFERISREAERRKSLMGSGGDTKARPARERRLILAGMDRSRLYRGGIGEAASRAEKAFGWSREQMFNMAVRWEAKVIGRIEAGSSLTGAVFGDVVEEARAMIPAVKNPETRKTLEKASTIITPEFAAGTLDRIFSERPAEAKPAIVALEASPLPALPSPELPGTGTQPNQEAAGPADGNRLLAEQNRRNALLVADAAVAGALTREALEAEGKSLILGPLEGQVGPQFFETYFPGELTLFERVRVQTVKFDRRRHGLPSFPGVAKAGAGSGR